ncbi:TetR/AcrR family transcriptional regulator [Dongia sedimenti]|uniref:TetR/AcrR family transcriptional regulator n=1 Tax=Dongia sedimenti TaxID=3064282 RepID=A0ABU0YMB0_9PROT|nr:TetR/AcrR family transcriptional regulator [Rhodospirillaceae bacterium R-7]
MAETKDKARPRGRPRGFEPETALARARDVFWAAGFAASSLDELSAAMEMSRPSVYAAFGDKEALYLRALADYRDASAAAMRAALDPGLSPADGLRAVYRAAIAVYCADPAAPRGCLLIGTAATESVRNPRVRQALAESLALFNAILEERFRLARKAGELDTKADPAMLAKLAASLMFALAVRARAGEDRAALESLADAGVDMLCGAPAKTGRKRS